MVEEPAQSDLPVPPVAPGLPAKPRGYAIAQPAPTGAAGDRENDGSPCESGSTIHDSARRHIGPHIDPHDTEEQPLRSRPVRAHRIRRGNGMERRTFEANVDLGGVHHPSQVPWNLYDGTSQQLGGGAYLMATHGVVALIGCLPRRCPAAVSLSCSPAGSSQAVNWLESSVNPMPSLKRLPLGPLMQFTQIFAVPCRYENQYGNCHASIKVDSPP